MASYFISYDLRNEGDYQPITDELEKFNAIRVLESCWRFKRYSTDAKALEKYFSNFINSGDGLIVSQIAEINGLTQFASQGLLG